MDALRAWRGGAHVPATVLLAEAPAYFMSLVFVADYVAPPPEHAHEHITHTRDGDVNAQRLNAAWMRTRRPVATPWSPRCSPSPLYARCASSFSCLPAARRSPTHVATPAIFFVETSCTGCTPHTQTPRVRRSFTPPCRLFFTFLTRYANHPLHTNHTVDPAAFGGDSAVRRLCGVPCPPSTVLLPQLSRHRGQAPGSAVLPLAEAIKLLGAGISLAGTGSLLGGGPAAWEVSAAVQKGRSGTATQAAELVPNVGAVSLQVAQRWVEVRVFCCLFVRFMYTHFARACPLIIQRKWSCRQSSAAARRRVAPSASSAPAALMVQQATILHCRCACSSPPSRRRS